MQFYRVTNTLFQRNVLFYRQQPLNHKFGKLEKSAGPHWGYNFADETFLKAGLRLPPTTTETAKKVVIVRTHLNSFSLLQ